MPKFTECRKCMCWRDNLGRLLKSGGPDNEGWCIRHAPAPTLENLDAREDEDYGAQWPRTMSDDHCFDGIPRPTPRKAKRT